MTKEPVSMPYGYVFGSPESEENGKPYKGFIIKRVMGGFIAESKVGPYNSYGAPLRSDVERKIDELKGNNN